MTGWVYVAEIDGMSGRLKIGKTNWHNPEDRIHDISRDTGAPGEMLLVYAALFEDPGRVELEVHEHLHDYRVKGEWFEISADIGIDAIRECSGLEIIEERISDQRPIGETKSTIPKAAEEIPKLIHVVRSKLNPYRELDFSPPALVWYNILEVLVDVKKNAELGDSCTCFLLGRLLLFSEPFWVPENTNPIATKLNKAMENASSEVWYTIESLRRIAHNMWVREAVELIFDRKYRKENGLKFLKQVALQGNRSASQTLCHYFDGSLSWKRKADLLSVREPVRESIKWALLAADQKLQGQDGLDDIEDDLDDDEFEDDFDDDEFEDDFDDDDISFLSRWPRIIFGLAHPPEHPSLNGLSIKTRDELYEELEICGGMVELDSDLGRAYEGLIGAMWSEVVCYAHMALLTELRSVEEAPIILNSLDQTLTRRKVRQAHVLVTAIWTFIEKDAREKRRIAQAKYLCSENLANDWRGRFPQESIFALCARKFEGIGRRS